MKLLFISSFFSPVIKSIICVAGVLYGLYILRSGIRKERKSFFWIGGLEPGIRNPKFNIIYGIFLLLIFSFGVFWYLAEI